ncbi:hypothetical protein LPJ61_000118 [Coemansia biformis]|uniref:PH domain-containing protein n=1 Tax=Coemansia biformis TaxID=1286918 RepID=A0A9W8D0T1_9FUNG|nr:hypothetical protein LPJ61_000118 [Coemansia biformis]
MPSTKPAGPAKQSAFSSRPVSTSSGASAASALDTPEPATTLTAATSAAASAAAKLAEGLGSLSTMPTPRNTFLTPPTGIAIPEDGPPAGRAWPQGPPPAHPHAGRASYDDTYSLLGLLADGPRSRAAAIAALQGLAAADDRISSGGSGRTPIASVPLPLASPIAELGEVEDALMSIIARRQIPNRIQMHCPPTGGAGSSPAPADAGDGRPARRRPRPSVSGADADGAAGAAGADDRHSMRSHASALSSENAPSIASSATPYLDLNGHMERLAACISRLQVVSADGHAPQALGTRAGSMVSLRPPAFHGRKGSIASTHMSLPTHYDPNHRRPSLARLSPVSESPVIEAPLERRMQAHSRSSSHLSVISGMSTESRRRIMVAEMLTSAHYPGLFGSPVADMPSAGNMHSHRSPSSPGQGAPSIRGESSYSHDSSDARTHPSPPLLEQGLAASHDPQSAPSTPSRPQSKSGSVASSSNPLSIMVRDITPASRVALWLNLHTTAEPQRPSLWRRKQWQRRFFIFAGNVIYLFKTSSPVATALSLVRLFPNTIVCVNDSFANRSWVIEITHPATADGEGKPQPQQSWYLQPDTRSEMIILLKQLKAVTRELQVQPDIERREEERMRDRRRKHRTVAKAKSDICPWEVDEFSDAGSDAGEAAAKGCQFARGASGFPRIADEELFSDADADERPLAAARTNRGANAVNLEKYSLCGGAAAAGSGARPARLQIGDYTGTGGIAEWGAHRMQVPYSPAQLSAGSSPAKMRSYSEDPAAGGRRPSLADVLVPPASAEQEHTPIPHRSPAPSPQIIRSMSLTPGASPAVRNSTMVKADATALIDQMFASASRQLAVPEDSGGKSGSTADGTDSVGSQAMGTAARNCLSVVCEED